MRTLIRFSGLCLGMSLLACSSDPEPKKVEASVDDSNEDLLTVPSTDSEQPPEANLDTSPASELDLLFVIDNSTSMGDKQAILNRSIAPMLERFAEIGLDDIHLGVITSSLGGHGSPTVCQRGEPNPESPSGFWDADDRAYLIPHVRAQISDAGVPSAEFSEGAGFLAWNGGDEVELNALQASFSQHIAGAGEHGCGFEAPLEAWYRFLVDPTPPAEIVLNDSQETVSTGLDPLVLAQREAFLRPGGLVGIVLVTDEDDCSIMDGGSFYENATFGYLTSKVDANFRIPPATSVCDDNPNDKCCFSCLDRTNPPSGCSTYLSECEAERPAEDDRANVRCHDQERRFGVDLLYPKSRYVEALTRYEITDARSGGKVDNPLLRGVGSHAGTSRQLSRVFLTGIVGVPWQDVATPETLDDPAKHELLSAEQLAKANVDVRGELVSRFELMLGRPGASSTRGECQEADVDCGRAPVLPFDPFMIPSIAPRIGRHASGENFPAAHPITGAPIVEPTSSDPLANDINGHEVAHGTDSPVLGGPANDDLQYACIFELEEPRMCDAQASCDCSDEFSRNRPLCQPTTGGVAGTTQYFAKAYPSPRIISVLEELGPQAIVSSICPKVTSGDPSDPHVGYNPTFEALSEKIQTALNSSP